MEFGRPACRVLALLALLALLVPFAAVASVESELAFHRGVVAYGDESWDEARRQFEIVLAEDAEDTTAIHYLALIAQAQGDPATALEHYDRALALDPEDVDLLVDRGTLRLDTGQVAAARADFAKAIELDPDNAKAQLLAGMAAHRAGDHEAAKPHLDRAGELDAELRDEARYYTGLSEAMLGNLQAAATAFDSAAAQSPLSPLGQSASTFQRQIETPREPERAWQLSLTVGSEFDSNSLLSGQSGFGITVPNEKTDGRAVFRPHASYRFFDGDGFNVTAGYDGYLSVHFSQTTPNLQTHNPWVSVSGALGPAYLSLRYDYAFNMIDTADPLRHLNRVTPSALFTQGDWGATLLYYQFHHEDWIGGAAPRAYFDRDGLRHVPGLTQFFFLPEPFSYVRIGAQGDFLDTDGTEFEYDGVRAHFGAGYDFPAEITLSWLYEFEYRDYQNNSGFTVAGALPANPPPPAPAYERRDHQHRITAELSKMLTDHWELAVTSAFTWNDSNVPFFDIDRYVTGLYVTYHF